MGSQIVCDPRWAAVLGHALNPDQQGVGYWIQDVASVSLGTSTARTLLGGVGVQGTGGAYVVPTAVKCIVAVRPKIYETTPTANQAVLAAMQILSADLALKDYEVFANPLDSGLGTNEMQTQDAAPWYPFMAPTYGNERVFFYGTAQVANTVAPLMGVDLLLSDTWPEGFNGNTGKWNSGYSTIQSKIAGINSGGGPTATGIAAGSVATDGGLTVASPYKRLLGCVGALVGTTPAASKPVAGQFSINAPELSQNPLTWNADPITGFLGTTTTGQQVHLSTAFPMNMLWKTTSTIYSKFTLDTAISTAGNFAMQYIYRDVN